jgi:C4-dicarboxylate transporter
MKSDPHAIFQLIGLMVCLLSSTYLILKGRTKEGSLFLIGFLLIAQSILLIQFIGLEPAQGECWATKSDFYACQPLLEKLSFHGSQLGYIIIALGLFLLGKNTNENP